MTQARGQQRREPLEPPPGATAGGGPLAPSSSGGDVGGTRRGLVIVVAAVLAYCIVHAGFRLLASSSLGEDDPLENVLAQSLRLGYLPPQPPLYDWVLFGVQKVTGPGIAGFLLIKYAALTATAVLLYLSAVRVLRDWLWAALTVECMALIYQIAWRYHEGFTHEVGAMVAVAATVWAWLRTIERGRPRDALLVGVIAGLGAMTEPTYWAFLAALTAASLLQPAIRDRLARPQMLLAAAAALAVAAPYVVWIASFPGPITWVHAYSPNWLKTLGKGLLDAVRGPLFYLSPLIVIVPVVFPGSLGVALRDLRRAPESGGTPDLAQLILHTALAGMVLCLAGAAVLGLAGYAMHQLMPLYLPSVIWLMSVAQRASAGSATPRLRFARLAAAIAVLALTVRLANMFVLDPVCKICRWGVPYPGLAAEIRRLGFTGGNVITPDVELAGNLRAQIPWARVSVPGIGTPAMAAAHSIGPDAGQAVAPAVAYVWAADARPSRARKTPAAAAPLDGHGIDEAATVTVPWRHLWRPTGYRSSSWKVLVVKSGAAAQRP